ncbi:MAG TPA: phytanoyl-CoA dioxygenase family protein [Capsulimonadaceae bacterium]|nr:phytanoyl-CoA dioxygenase family protein [Capsulimonadaceae bacterium]
MPLTKAQRFHFDAYGFVVLENVLTAGEVEAMCSALYRLRAEKDLQALGVYSSSIGDHHFHMGHIVEYDRALRDFAVHPELLSCVEDVVGGAVFLEESEAIINRRAPHSPTHLKPGEINPIGFHTGTRHGWGTYFEKERFHCLFVKTIAYLTDVGPTDGGTAVIPGSHKMSWPESEMIEAAKADPRLIEQVEAKAGSVLLFAESLIHSTTEITSDRERVIAVSGYTPTMFRPWDGNELSRPFIDSLPENIKPVLTGQANWNWRRNNQT